MSEMKVALVTGAGSGIGRATALRLSSDGMAVAVVDIVADAAQKVVEEIKANGGKAVAFTADVSSEKSVDEMFDAVLNEFGHIDNVAANAGIFMPDHLTNMIYDRWDKIMSINFEGAMLCTKKAAEVLIKQNKGGRIACTVSQGGFAQSDGGTVAYCVSKWAARGFVKSLARRTAKYGINVNAIAPGNIPTPMMDGIIKVFAQGAGAPEEVIAQSMVNASPLARLQPTEEMAALYSYLFSDKASNITGLTIIDNGAGMFGG